MFTRTLASLLLMMSGFACACVSAADTGGGAMIAPTTADAKSCNRRCLLEILTVYTEALTDNKPATVPASDKLRVTANGTVTKIGESDVWGSPRRIPYRQAFVDPTTGAALFYGVITNDITPRNAPAETAQPAKKWWYYVVRLQVEQHKVTEIEEVFFDDKFAGGDPASLSLPDRIFDTVLPAAERSTREQLINTANLYFDAVSHSIDYHKVPWHPECQRVELGVFTVNAARAPGSCGGEFQNPAVKWIVANRRFYIADVERGVVFGIGNFTIPPDFPNNNGSVVLEIFKVQDGLIRHISAFFRGSGQKHSGWGEGPGS